MVAVVGNVVDEVDFGGAFFGGVFLDAGGDADEGFVVEFFGVREVDEHLLDLLVHLFFALLGVLAKAFDDERMYVIVVLVLGLWREHWVLSEGTHRGGK